MLGAISDVFEINLVPMLTISLYGIVQCISVISQTGRIISTVMLTFAQMLWITPSVSNVLRMNARINHHCWVAQLK